MTMTAEHPMPPDGITPADPPPKSPAPRRSGGSIRYPAKLARRELRRRPWRALLVVALIALPTWTMLNVAMYARTVNSVDTVGYDYDADLVVRFANPASGTSDRSDEVDSGLAERGLGGEAVTEERVKEALPAGSTVQVVMNASTAIMTADGTIEDATFTTADLTSKELGSWAEIREGRAPEPGEVAVGGYLAQRLGVGAGDTLRLREPEGTWRIAGIVGSSSDDLLVIPDFDHTKLVSVVGELLINLPADAGLDEADRLMTEFNGYAPAGSRFAPDMSQYSDSAGPIALIWLAAMMVFVMFGVIIVAAFATIARGQLVTVGQLAANGATHKVTRRFLSLQGFWTGLTGVAIGVVATVLALPLTRRLIIAGMYGPSPSLVWSPVDVAVVGAIGVVVATVAATLPALSLVRISVLDALAGRRPERPVPRWMVPVGLATFGLGLLLLVVSVTAASSLGIAGAMLGALAMAIGVCLIGPFVIQLAGKAAPVMPLSVKVSVRGLARSRLRSAAVVSSIAVTTGVMAVIIAGAQAATRGAVPGETADNVAIVGNLPSMVLQSADGEALLDKNGEPLADNPADIATVSVSWAASTDSALTDLTRGVLPDAAEQPIRVAVRAAGVYDNTDILVSKPDDADSGGVFGYGGFPAGIGIIEELGNLPIIADDATVAAYSLPDSFKKDLLVAGYGYAMPPKGAQCNDDVSSVEDWDGAPVETPADDASSFVQPTPAAIPVTGASCWTMVGPFMTEQFADAHGYDTMPAGTLFTNPTPLTEGQRDQLQSEYRSPSLFVDWDYAGVFPQSQGPAAESSVTTYSYSAFSPGVMTYYPTLSDGDYALAQMIVLGIAVVFVTLIAGIGLGLASADSRRDRAVLSVIGAKPGTQRRVAATDALVLVVIGTLLGVPAALFASRVVTVATKSARPTGVPWLFVAAEFVVVPLVVTAIAYLAGSLRRSSPQMRVLQVD